MSDKKGLNSGFHHLFDSKFDKEMTEVGLFLLFVNLGKSLIAISFIYHLYENLHFEVWQIFLFYFFTQLPFVLSGPFVGKIVGKIGLKHSISLRSFGSMLFYLSLPILLSTDFWQSILFLFPIFIFRAIGRNTSNIAYDIFMTHHLNKGKSGKSVAWMQIAIMMASVIAPILGAVITANWGFDWVTYFGVVLMIFSAVVLYLTPDEKFKVPYTSNRLISDTLNKTPRTLFYSEWGRCFFDGVLWVVWPVFLILIFAGQLVHMGILVGCSSGVAMILAFFIGKKLDKKNTNTGNVLKWGAYRSTFLNFFRAIWLEPITISIVDALSKVNDQTIKIPYNVELYKWLHAKNTFERAHIRRIIAEYFYTIPLLFFTIIFMIFRDAPVWIFVFIFALSAFSLSFTSQILRIKNLKNVKYLKEKKKNLKLQKVEVKS